MVYKKYITRNGKVYGPYYYHSRRVNGKVVSEYHGGDEEKKKKVNFNFNAKKFVWPVVGVLFLVLFAYAITSFDFNFGSPSGHVILDLGANYQEGMPLEGSLDLTLNEGELIPVSSKVIFETSGQTYEYNLQDIVSDQVIEGNFYVAGKTLSGTGAGYGGRGIKEISPIVYFELDIYSTSEDFEEPIVETPTAEDPITEESVVEDNTTGITDIISNFFLALTPTGNAILELDSTSEGQVSVGNDFYLELLEGQYAEIVLGSVRTDEAELSENILDLSMQGTTVVITTDYSEVGYGFGEQYMGETEKEINMDFSSLGMMFEPGTLKISIVYADEEIVSLTTLLGDGTVEASQETTPPEDTTTNPLTTGTIIEPEIEIPLPETPTTPDPTANVEGLTSGLTDLERAAINVEFGGDSIVITKAKAGKNRITIRYELGTYWAEKTYDSSLSKEALSDQMGDDKNKWLKDIASNLLEEEPIVEEIEDLLGNYSIN